VIMPCTGIKVFTRCPEMCDSFPIFIQDANEPAGRGLSELAAATANYRGKHFEFTRCCFLLAGF